jgi:hypothetical protein
MEGWKNGMMDFKKKKNLLFQLIFFFAIIPAFQCSMTPRDSGIVRRWIRKSS